MSKQTIAIIGGGNMGEALIKGLYTKAQIHVIEADSQRAKYLKKKYQVRLSMLAEAINAATVIVFAVKPQDMLTAIAAVNEVRAKGKNLLYISIAAGLSTSYFEKHLGVKPRIMRSMPNMPGLIGEGITGVAPGRFTKPADIKQAVDILSSIGQVMMVDEKQIDAVTAVSGSGPAYVFLFVEEWIIGLE